MRSGLSGESTTEHQWSGTRLWPCSFAEKEFLQRWKVVKQVRYLLEGKKSTIHVDRHMGRLRRRVPELHTCGSLNPFSRGIPSRSPVANHFDLPGSRSIFVISRDPPMWAAGWQRRGHSRAGRENEEPPQGQGTWLHEAPSSKRPLRKSSSQGWGEALPRHTQRGGSVH